jgi:molecular chaperone GrpE
MCPKPDEIDADDEKEASLSRKAAELEASLKKPQLEETYLNQLKYARADIENLQKNADRRINEGVAREKEKLIMKVLLVAEELDLAVEEARKAANINILEGIEMVERKLWDILSSEGLRSIEAVGKPFDPHLHEAVLEIETSDHPEGTVVGEVRKGYLIKEKVLRPSMVKVASMPSHNALTRNEK